MSCLRLLLPEPAVVQWGRNGRQDSADIETRPIGLGQHMADLPTKKLVVGPSVEMTFRQSVRDAPLGNRIVIDGSTGKTISVSGGGA